jgi:hypothetical protein
MSRYFIYLNIFSGIVRDIGITAWGGKLRLRPQFQGVHFSLHAAQIFQDLKFSQRIPEDFGLVKYDSVRMSGQCLKF